MLPIIALLGRPNVGKSTLFNRLVRGNRALTHDRPGVTRDRLMGQTRRLDIPAKVIDTGGVTLDSTGEAGEGPRESRGFEAEILDQARRAVAEAQVLVLVVDGRDGLTPLDEQLARMLRKSGKPLLLAVNKIDGREQDFLRTPEFHALGLDLVPLSAAHGYNFSEFAEALEALLKPYAPAVSEDAGESEAPEEVDDEAEAGLDPNAELDEDAEAELDAAFLEDEDSSIGESLGEDGLTGEAAGESEEDESAADSLVDGDADDSDEDPDEETLARLIEAELAAAEAEAEAEDDETRLLKRGLRVAMLGRPNAGKSSMVNALVGDVRMIVSELAGTTRDSVDVTADLEIGGRPTRTVFVDTAGVRRRTKITDALERMSVTQALKTSHKADVTILVLDALAGLAAQDKRLIALLDERKTPFIVAVNKMDLVQGKEKIATRKIYEDALSFCKHVPLLFVSAKSGTGLNKLLPMALDLFLEAGSRVPTGQLNRVMTEIIQKHQAPYVKGRRARFYYMTQAGTHPPTFVFFVNDPERVHQSYSRYLENGLRRVFGLQHTPIRVRFRGAHGQAKASQGKPGFKTSGKASAKSSGKPTGKSSSKTGGRSGSGGKGKAGGKGKPGGKGRGKGR